MKFAAAISNIFLSPLSIELHFRDMLILRVNPIFEHSIQDMISIHIINRKKIYWNQFLVGYKIHQQVF